MSMSLGWWVLGVVIAFLVGWRLALRKAERRARLRYRRKLRQIEREQVRALADAAESESHVEALAAASPDALLRIDGQGRVEWANAIAVERLGVDLGRPASLIAITGSAALEEILYGLLPGQPLEEMVTIGDRRFRVGLARSSGDKTFLSFRDETENERLTRARRDMVANISHDLRTPLTAIGLLVDSLDEPELAPHERTNTVAKIRDQLAVLRRLAEGLVALNRLESGRLPLRLRAEPLAPVIADVIEALRPQLERHGIEVAVEHVPELLVLMDRDQVGRVLTNLLENAMDASSPGDRVLIEAHPTTERDLVEILVRDEGSGIPPRDIPRIFERFYRGDRARGLRGSGLGLAIVKHIVERHGGSVSARNNPDRGACIRFTLPAGESSPARPDGSA